MSDYREQLAGAVKAVVIQSPTLFSWFGKESPRLAPHIERELTPRTARSYLYYALQSTLYNHFYCMGMATSAQTGAAITSESLASSAEYIEQLSQANTGRGYWSEGWESVALAGLEPQVVAARRNDLLVLLREGDYELAEAESADGLHVFFTKELTSVSPGFYMAVSDLDFDLQSRDSLDSGTGRPRSPLVRLYWHVTPEGALGLMSLLTMALNGAGIPFNFKIVNNPERFTRCDSAVLYIHSEDCGRVAALLSPIYAQLSMEMQSAVPALTLPLAPGLGLAEDPGDGGSFGLHRCGLIAEGLIRAYEMGERTPEERLDAVIGVFGEAGISLGQPYLGAGSSGGYSFAVENIATSSKSADVKKRAHLDSPHVEIARQLIKDAVWHEGRCTWLGTEVRMHSSGPAGRRSGSVLREEWRTLGPDLYTGTAGVALFLAEYSVAMQDADARKTALAAIRQSFYKADTISMFARPGLYTGWLGIALAGARIGLIAGNAETVESARSLALKCASEGHPGHEHDLLAGSAGAIVAALLLAEMLGEPSLRDYATRLGDDLLSSARRQRHAGLDLLSWPQVEGSTSAPLTGFSHGAAGIAYALLELWHASSDTRYRQAAEGAFNYEARWYNSEVGNWPDFREVAPRPGKSGHVDAFAYATFWCHGAPGIALSRQRAYELTGDTQRHAEALAAIRTTERAVREGLESGSGNYSLCHGLSGNATILLDAGRTLDVSNQNDMALEVAEDGQRRRLATGIWSCGTGGKQGAQSPGLMLGLAGIGHFYLRLAQPHIPSVLFVNSGTWSTGGT